ncbi:MAG: hypothetical protein AB7S77_01905 [Desulfatirhabdiaceae bacterium]
MKDIHEKRGTNRYMHESPIQCSYFNHPVKKIAVTVNASDEGMFFLSDEAFPPGAMIQIYTPGSITNNVAMPFTVIAEVKWCRKSMDSSEQYEVGVAYLPDYTI